jgi:RNA polymerase sigma-70 factor (ECF subfamily)
LGLEALLWFHHCRRSARQDAEGGIIFLEAQDRSLFVQRELEHAEELLHRALAKKRVGPYQLQASIAAAHCCSPSFELTPWPLIIQLYARLYELQPSPVVALNWAGAVGLGEGAERGLEEIQRHGLARSLAEYSPYHSARAELLSRAGHTAEARAAFEKAAELAQGGAEVALIRRRLKEISEN